MAKVNLHRDFRGLLESLNSAGVKYLVLGGYAVIFYGYERVTKDLDLWISTDAANAEKVAQTLLFGLILTNASALSFDDCYARRQVVEWDGVKVPLISFQDLRNNKKASGRAKDLADLDRLPSEPAQKQKRRGK